MDYRGSGFWVRDWQAEVWLYLMGQQAQAKADVPAWLAAAASDWHTQATAGFGGCVASCLDEHLGQDADRVAVAMDVADGVMNRLTAWFPAIPRDIVNAFGTGGGATRFETDLSVEPLLACGRTFIRLLRGELSPGRDRWAG